MKKNTITLLPVLLLISCTSTSSETEKPLTYHKEEYHISQGEIDIYGNLFTPLDFSETSSYPLVILSHSANVNSDTHNSYAARLVDLGYLAYTFDYPGSSSSSRSTDISSCTIFTEKETLLTVIDELSVLSYTTDVFLFGTSQGGLVSSIAAEERADMLSGMVLFYPAYNIPELMLQFPSSIDEEYQKQLEEFDVYEVIGKEFTKDVLIVHGDSDFIVPVKYSEQAKEKYTSCTLEVVAGATHGFNKENYAFSDQYDKPTWNFASDFFTSHLK